MYVLIITSVLASQIAFHNAINRYTFNLARDGLLPARLAHTHPRFGSPSTAGTAQTVLAAVVVGAFAIAGADPYIDLLLKVNTPGVVGIIAAAGDHLGRGRGVLRPPPAHRPSARAATVCAAVAAVLLTVARAILLATHIDLLTRRRPADQRPAGRHRAR